MICMVLITTAACALGLIFLAAGTPKLANPESFVNVVQRYRVLPETLAIAYATILPTAEVLAGLSLLLGLGVRTSSAIVGAMLCSFGLAVFINIARDRAIDCNCFGTVLKRKVGVALLIQDGLLLLLTCLTGFAGSWTGCQQWSIAWLLMRKVGIPENYVLAGSAVLLLAILSLALSMRRIETIKTERQQQPSDVGSGLV